MDHPNHYVSPTQYIIYVLFEMLFILFPRIIVSSKESIDKIFTIEKKGSFKARTYRRL